MRTEFPCSYGRMHPETAPYSLAGALMSMYAEMSDVMDIEIDAMRDGSDGRIDDPELVHRILKEVTEMIQSAQRVKSLIPNDKEGGGT